MIKFGGHEVGARGGEWGRSHDKRKSKASTYGRPRRGVVA